MINLIQLQLNSLLEEIEMVTDTYQRANLRVKLINALSNLTTDEPVYELEGKDSIKNDFIKENKTEDITFELSNNDTQSILFEDNNSNDSQIEINQQEEQEQQIKEPEIEFINVSEQKEVQEEITEPILLTCYNENEEEYQLDITEALIAMNNKDLENETILEIAKNITEHNLVPIYQTLKVLDDTNNKMMLAYYLQQFGLEAVNEFLTYLTDGQFTDLYEFVNNDNVEGLVVNLEESSQE